MKKQEALINLSYYKDAKGLAALLEKAKHHNHLNQLLKEVIPAQLKGITLCLIQGEKAVFIAENSALAFRAQKQRKDLLVTINELKELSHIKSISIKVNKIS